MSRRVLVFIINETFFVSIILEASRKLLAALLLGFKTPLFARSRRRRVIKISHVTLRGGRPAIEAAEPDPASAFFPRAWALALPWFHK